MQCAWICIDFPIERRQRWGESIQMGQDASISHILQNRPGGVSGNSILSSRPVFFGLPMLLGMNYGPYKGNKYKLEGCLSFLPKILNTFHSHIWCIWHICQELSILVKNRSNEHRFPLVLLCIQGWVWSRRARDIANSHQRISLEIQLWVSCRSPLDFRCSWVLVMN